MLAAHRVPPQLMGIIPTLWGQFISGRLLIAPLNHLPKRWFRGAIKTLLRSFLFTIRLYLFFKLDKSFNQLKNFCTWIISIASFSCL